MLGRQDIAIFRSLFDLSGDIILILESTQLALGTLFLEDHQCICFVLYREFVNTISVMTSCSSSLAPRTLPVINTNDDEEEEDDEGEEDVKQVSCTYTPQWCQTSLYLEAAFASESACQVSKLKCSIFYIYIMYALYSIF